MVLVTQVGLVGGSSAYSESGNGTSMTYIDARANWQYAGYDERGSAGRGAGIPYEGTGGLLVIFCSEASKIGSLSSVGSQPPSISGYWSCFGGGGSGGGSINLFYNIKNDSKEIEFNVNGGNGGIGLYNSAPYVVGGKGGAGSYTEGIICDEQYVNTLSN